jgi:hypothetical protein
VAASGHEDAFPPTKLSNRSRLGKPTFAGTRGNEQDAPIPAARLTTIDREQVDPKLPFAARDPG